MDLINPNKYGTQKVIKMQVKLTLEVTVDPRVMKSVAVISVIVAKLLGL